MTSHWISPFVRRLAVREWLTILAAMLLIASTLGWQNGLGRLDQTLYDQLTSFNGRPAHDDIIIIAIDDYSLTQLGRWPWSRTLHAELIEQVTKARPRVIGFDVILSEPEHIQADGKRSGDLALSKALKTSGRTILPLVMANMGAGFTAALPIPELAHSARILSHINLAHDSDGVVRSIFLHEGANGTWWPHFSLAMAQLGASAGTNAKDGHGVKKMNFPSTSSQAENAEATRRHPGWQRDGRMHIAFAGNSGHFRSIPYVSVLRGEVPDQFFTNKYVLIGATAVGMTDSYPTPVSGGTGAMSGIEINANVLASLLEGKAITIAKPWQTALFNAIPVLIALLAYLLLSPRAALLMNIGLLLTTAAASYLALRSGLWLAPMAAFITLIISYPLWSWRRLEAAINYLGQEFMRLDQEPHLLPELTRSSDIIEDVLERRINAMENAARRVRDLRQFVSDSLDSLPDAILVTNIDGQVLLTNKHANSYLTSIEFQKKHGALLPYLFTTLASPQPITQPYDTQFNWWNLLDLHYAAVLEQGVSAQDQLGRDLLVKSAPCRSANNVLTGWIISIIDISTIRSAERSRDETLRFLSHDMRAPQASILALLELQNDQASAMPQEEFFSRIEKASRKTLGLADNFVQLARAESQEYRLEEVDFQDIVCDAIDEMWTQAKNKHIELVTDIPAGEYPMRVDRTLMTRALVNLISNAINYSPPNTSVECALRFQITNESSQIICSVSDHGYGIAPADQARLFQRFQRMDVPDQPRHDGIGLGLVFVKTVVERHLGHITFTSKVGVSTVFTMMLPCTLDNI